MVWPVIYMDHVNGGWPEVNLAMYIFLGYVYEHAEKLL